MQNMNHPSQVLRLLFTCIIQAFSPAIQDLFRNIATAILLPARQPVNFRLGGHRLLPTLFRLPAPFRHFRHPSGTSCTLPAHFRHPHYPKTDASKMQHLRKMQKIEKKDRASLHGRKRSGRNRPPRSTMRFLPLAVIGASPAKQQHSRPPGGDDKDRCPLHPFPLSCRRPSRTPAFLRKRKRLIRIDQPQYLRNNTKQKLIRQPTPLTNYPPGRLPFTDDDPEI